MSLSTDEIFVTTRKKPTQSEEAEARALAARFALPFVRREGRSIAHHARGTGRKAALVLRAEAIHLVMGETRLGFHPNMAARRIAGGARQGDHFLSAGGIGPSDHVLDCTCGMGADAITAAHAVGPKGRVVALEAAPILAQIVARGMAHYPHGSDDLRAAMGRVEVIHAEAKSHLASLPSSSFDVVAIDPMFEWKQGDGHGLDLVRLLAHGARPDAELINQATRVARRAVIMADGAPGPRLTALNIPIVSQDRRRWWGRIET